jgi:two-component system KDP operon response regulator KdpE
MSDPEPVANGRVLVVDDDPRIARTLEVNLRARHYEVDLAATGEVALQLAARRHPDVVILDLGLPGMDGLDVVRGLRGWTAVPIVVLSARGSEAAKVEALDLGADDYLTKPFGMDELFARLRASMRRAVVPEERAVVTTPHFTIDFTRKEAVRDGQVVRLTPTQWHIVEVLVRHAGRLVTYEQILREVWGPSYGKETNYLRVFMTQIRQKLEPGRQPRYFVTEAGIGFRFEAPGDTP